MPPGVRRRAPGLRREEVALLAGMSVDYYTRLEQGRGPQPSTQILASLARALRLSDDEREHLYHLSGQVPPQRHSTGQHVSPGMLHLLDHLDETPAFVVSDLNEVLVQNEMSRLVSGDLLALPADQRNHTWRWFTVPGARDLAPREDWDTHSRTHVADLRATAGRRAGDPDVEDLVTRLLEASEEFRTLWVEHDVAVRRADEKRYVHPEVGLLDLLCETLVSGVNGQVLVVLFPRPGTDCREKLELLRVVGRQRLDV